MSDWYWRVIALKAAFALTCLVSYLSADVTIQKLPFCNPHNANGASDDAGGKWVRLVPSLRGTLYSLSGDTIEPLPFDAEQLLSSSFKYSDDLVIGGARETLWLGIDAHTGTVIYECGSAGCSSEQTAGAGREVLVLRRQSSTVRALEPHSGQEKWNFSVAEHQLAVSRRECMGASAPPSPVTVGVDMPEGVVAVRLPGSQKPLWQQKLEAPVASMWRLQGGTLQHVDVLWQAAQALAEAEPLPPSLYIGVHDRQLYIQESVMYAQKVETSVAAKPVPWKLKHSRPLLSKEETALSLQDDPDLSLVALYRNPGQTGNHGFFLYIQETCDQAVQVSDEKFEVPDVVLPNNSENQFEHHHVHVHVYSLWFWWKEVFLITVSTALLLNLLIWPKLFAPKLRPPTPLPVNQEVIVVERHYERPPSNNTKEYSGRYENDFTPLRCLGQGGFGVVFEARNNIDHCSYAVKRITLPKRQSKRERVLREVRALAKLEHENIVRYFNAWLEEPPPEWQEKRDAILMRELGSMSVLSSEEASSATPKSPPNSPTNSPTNSPKADSVTLNLHKPLDHCIDALDYDKQLREPKRHRKVTHVTGRWTCACGRWGARRVGGGGVGGSKMYLYIQMQLCRRDSLHDWLRHNRTWEARRQHANVLFSQIVSAVEYVHLAGLIHRDLKPSNIFFAPDGRVKVGDFGLVTTMGDNSQDGEPTEIDVYARHTHRVGTHLYMSPEQVVGRPYNYKVDIYSLGLVLFELLQPFGTEAERVHCLLRLRSGIYPDTFQHTYPAEVRLILDAIGC
ncbi:Eukaryotic translation initiation factor 2-alpha kinase [Papilio machaon]|uniref:non-specific serine/threonine protein kinase n=1 Tax=Papilio machaon TaxID=76193 RepID=A0A194RMH8_PAPMA|nr:Eukaryotic translation initiation factor 2-alpha kinase [Papilio machaon]